MQPPGTTDDIRLLSPDSRKASLNHRVSVRVRTYCKIHTIPDGYVEPAIKALVAHDLALIPLLHDRDQLDAKIQETLAVLQGDPELDINLGVQPTLAPSSPTKLHLKSIHSPEELESKLREEIERIDPMEVEEVMGILFATMQVADIRHAVQNKGYLAAKYNIAKKELIRRQSEVRVTVVPTSEPSSIASRSGAELTESHEAVVIKLAEDCTRFTAETVDLPSLVEMPVKDIMANLGGEEGDAILLKLGMSRPTATEAAALAKWTKGVMEKSGVERKAEIAGMMSKKLDVSTASSSMPESRGRLPYPGQRC
jgi:hypothetical protein